MEVLEINGKKYMKASRAAREAGYTSDYVGQLCRAGSIDAELVGRSWYVNVDELREHRKEKKRSSRASARKQVKEAVKATQQEIPPSTMSDKGRSSIVYREDSEQLFPQVMKREMSAHEVITPQEVSEDTPEASVAVEIRFEPNTAAVASEEAVVLEVRERFSEEAKGMIKKSPQPFIPRRIVRPSPQSKTRIVRTPAIAVKSQPPSLWGRIVTLGMLMGSFAFLIASLTVVSKTVFVDDVLLFAYTMSPSTAYEVVDAFKYSLK